VSSIESWGQEFSTVSSALFTFFNFLFNHSASKRNFWLASFPQAPTDDRIRRPRHCPPPASSAPCLFRTRPLPHPASSTPGLFRTRPLPRHKLLCFLKSKFLTVIFSFFFVLHTLPKRYCSSPFGSALPRTSARCLCARLLPPPTASYRLCSSVFAFDLARLRFGRCSFVLWKK
jgi:hypothetical protein